MTSDWAGASGSVIVDAMSRAAQGYFQRTSSRGSFQSYWYATNFRGAPTRAFPSQRDSHLYITPVTTLQHVKDHPEIIDGVRLGDRIYHSGIQGGIRLWSIITTLFLRLDPQQAEQFAEHLTTGVGLHRGHPVLMLRNRLLGSQRDQYSTLSGREAVVAIAIKAWNACREGKTLQTLSWRAEGRKAEPFPEAN